MIREITARVRGRAWLASLVVLGQVWAAGCRGGGAPAPASAAAENLVTVSATPVVRQAITRTLRVTGSLTADEQAEVSAETTGRIVSTPVERGTTVEQGSPLVIILATEAEAQLKEAEANVAQIEARLAVSPGGTLDIERVPEVANARAAKELAEAEFARIRKLYDERVVSQSEYDQRRTQVEATSQQLEVARNAAQQQYRTLEAARARLSVARKALADTVVRAPFSGAVVERKVSVGDFVTRGTRIATVAKISPLRVLLSVPEVYISAVQVGQAITLRVDAFPGREFKGHVRFVSPAVRADQRALAVEAVVPNADALLKAGLFATADIERAQKDSVLLVPSAALRVVAGKTRVFVVSGDRVVERVVTTGQSVDGSVEIVNGVAEGDTVAVSNVGQLSDGDRVRVTQSSAGAGRPAR